MQPRFDIIRTYLDGHTEIVGHATLGEQLIVPADRLTITPGFGATGELVIVQAEPGAKLSLQYGPETGLGTDDMSDDSG